MDNIQSSEENVCIICLDNIDYDDNIKDLQMFKDHYKNICYCSYKIHSECFKQWCNFNKSCPLCRKNFIYNTCIFNNTLLWNTYYNDNRQEEIDNYEIRRQQIKSTNIILCILFVILLAYFPLWTYNIINKIF